MRRRLKRRAGRTISPRRRTAYQSGCGSTCAWRSIRAARPRLPKKPPFRQPEPLDPAALPRCSRLDTARATALYVTFSPRNGSDRGSPGGLPPDTTERRLRLHGREARFAGCIALAVLGWVGVATPRVAAQEERVIFFVDSEPDLGSIVPTGAEQAASEPLLAFCHEDLLDSSSFAGPNDNSTPAPAASPLDLLATAVAVPIVGPPLAFDKALGVPHTLYGKAIYGVALRYALNPLFVAAIVEAESDFNPR